MSQQLMRCAARTTVATAAICTSLSSPPDCKLDTAELQQVSHTVFHGRRLAASTSSLQQCAVELGERLASNPTVQQAVMQEIEGYVFVTHAPGGPYVVLREEEERPESTEQQDEGKDEGQRERAAAPTLPRSLSAPHALSSLLASTVEVKSGEQYEAESDGADVTTPLPAEQQQQHPAVPQLPIALPVRAQEPSVLGNVMVWLQDKLDSILSIFTSAAPSQRSAVPAAVDSSAAASSLAAPLSGPSASSAAIPPAVEPAVTLAQLTAAVVGVATLLIVLTLTRRSQPALFQALMRQLR